jgi:ABC-type glycerol-3-phosphate transport system permease component
LAASAIFLFILAWNDFIAASVMISSPELRPVQLITFHFLGFYGREWGPLMASVNSALIPTVVLFLFLQKFFVSGLTRGGLK